jgi:hypothetical protein
VGSVVLHLHGRICAHDTEHAVDELTALDGVSACELDAASGMVLVAAVRPVDRTAPTWSPPWTVPGAASKLTPTRPWGDGQALPRGVRIRE